MAASPAAASRAASPARGHRAAGPPARWCQTPPAAPTAALLPLLLAATLLALPLLALGADGGAEAAPQPAPPGAPRPVLIVRFSPAGMQAGAAMAAGEPAAAAATAGSEAEAAAAASAAAAAASAAGEPAAAGAAAAAAAAARGDTPQGQRRAAGVAEASARAAPAAAALAASLSARAAARGARVARQAPLTAVFPGATLSVDSDEELRVLQEVLEGSPYVERVWVSRARSLPRPVDGGGAGGGAAPEPEPAPPAAGAAAAAQAAAAATAWSSSANATGLSRLLARHPGLDGTGTLVCVIDTGVQYDLEPFGRCSGIGEPKGACRVVVGRDLVGDSYDGTSLGPPPVEGDQPRDCYGHGTSVASIVSTSNGVAPGALLGAYRVFGCYGFAADDVIIRGIDRAVVDGCHIINLSLGSNSGFADGSVYKDAMEGAFAAGVVSTKAAGNSGVFGGYFQADVAVAAGSVSVGSLGDGPPVDSRVAVSSFSSFGPDPELRLGPHVCAPGASIHVLLRSGGYSTSNSGTSFSSPYVAGILALWRHHRQQLADEAAAGGGGGCGSGDRWCGQPRQWEALRAVAATAAQVPAGGAGALGEPVARCGGGAVQADALVENRLWPSPSLLQLPSQLASAQPFVATVALSWEGPPHPDGVVAFDASHRPSFSVPLQGGWVGTQYESRRRGAAARVQVAPQLVLVDTRLPAPQAEVQVNITLPSGLAKRSLLYSGVIRLTPRPTASAAPSPPLVPVGILYQGYSAPYSSLRVMARQTAGNPALADLAQADALCYSPFSATVVSGAVMDSENDLRFACGGGLARSEREAIRVSRAALRGSRCSLRVTLAPEVPTPWLFVDVLNGTTGRLLGSLAPLDLRNGNCLANAYQVYSWCLGFDGTFASAATGAKRAVAVGGTYRLRARAQVPACAGDAGARAAARMEQVPIKGMFQVIP